MTENGQLQRELGIHETKIKTLEDYMDKHLIYHQNEERIRRSRNWQLWILIISLVVGSFSGWLIALFR